MSQKLTAHQQFHLEYVKATGNAYISHLRAMMNAKTESERIEHEKIVVSMRNELSDVLGEYADYLETI